MPAPTMPRVLGLSELDALAYRSARESTRGAVMYSIARVSRSRVTVGAYDGNLHAEAVFPCYPGVDGVRVVLDPMRYTVGDAHNARRMFAPLLEGTL